MTDVGELERSIISAQSRGDTATVERLQAQYRSMPVIRVTREPCRVANNSASGGRTDLDTSRSLPMPGRVWIQSRALIDLLDHDWMTFREDGAWLFGKVFSDELEVHAVDGWIEGVRDEVVFRRDHRLEQRYAAQGLALIGDAHSHRFDYGVQESQADTTSWVKLSRDLQRPVVGLIVAATNEAFPFVDPELVAWTAANGQIRKARIIREEY